jgi:hypothetical protein
MKHLFVIALSIALCGAVQAQTNERFLGSWDFTTETGEPGYETGVVKISEESVSFTWVDCYLVLKDASHLTGFASWDSGETVLNLTRKEVDE